MCARHGRTRKLCLASLRVVRWLFVLARGRTRIRERLFRSLHPGRFRRLLCSCCLRLRLRLSLGLRRIRRLLGVARLPRLLRDACKLLRHVAALRRRLYSRPRRGGCCAVQLAVINGDEVEQCIEILCETCAHSRV